MKSRDEPIFTNALTLLEKTPQFDNIKNNNQELTLGKIINYKGHYFVVGSDALPPLWNVNHSGTRYRLFPLRKKTIGFTFHKFRQFYLDTGLHQYEVYSININKEDLVKFIQVFGKYEILTKVDLYGGYNLFNNNYKSSERQALINLIDNGFLQKIGKMIFLTLKGLIVKYTFAYQIWFSLDLTVPDKIANNAIEKYRLKQIYSVIDEIKNDYLYTPI